LFCLHSRPILRKIFKCGSEVNAEDKKINLMTKKEEATAKVTEDQDADTEREYNAAAGDKGGCQGH
jgi:hypothetical protein